MCLFLWGDSTILKSLPKQVLPNHLEAHLEAHFSPRSLSQMVTRKKKNNKPYNLK